jgi:hypothetical protein
MRRIVGCTKWHHERNEEVMEEEELKTEPVLEYTTKDRTGEIMSTEWIDEGSPNKFCSTCLGAEDLQGVRQKDGWRP